MGDIWLAQSVAHGTLDPWVCEFKPHVGPRAYLPKKSKRQMIYFKKHFPKFKLVLPLVMYIYPF